MKKLLLMSIALASSGLLAFWIGEATREPMSVEAQVAAFPKVEVQVVIEGIRGEFQAGIGGLGGSCELIEFRDGADPTLVRKLPGRLKWNDITLKRGFAGSDDPIASELYKWYQGVKAGDYTRKNGSIVLYDADDGTELAKYEFFDAWPCKWKGFSLRNADAIFPVEEIDLVVHKVQIAR